MYTVNLTSEEAVKKEFGAHVMDCAVLPDGQLVASEFPSGRIAIFARDGTRVRDLQLPGNHAEQSNMVAISKSGLIVSSPVCANTNMVYFLDPKDGQPLKIGTVDADQIQGEILVSSSGVVVVKTDDSEFTILDGNTGRVRDKITRAEWNEARCAVDRENDTIYICYISDPDVKPAIAVVDEVGIDGGMIRRGVIEFKQLVRPVITPMAMPGGQLVICNGKELLVYKKVSNKSSYSGKTWVKV